MKKKIAVRIVVASTAVAALALSGCSGGDDSGEGASLTYWATNMSPTIEQDEEVLKEHLAGFTEETGIEVEYEVVPWGDYYNKILTAVSSGEGPDVLNIGNTWSVTLQETGSFMPFDDDALEAIGGGDRFVETALESAGKPDETPTFVPLYSNVYSLFYKPSMFAAAGLTEPPKTYQEFLEYGKQLTLDTDGDGAIDQWGTSVPGASVQVGSHWAFILGQQEGADWFTEDGEPQVDSDGMVTAVHTYVNQVNSIAAPSDAEITEGAGAIQDFIDGTSAMIITQSPMAQFAQFDFTDWEVAEVPVMEGGENIQSMVAGINIGVFSETDQREDSLELVKYLTSDEEQVGLNSQFSTLPVVTAAYDDPALEEADPTIPVREVILSEHSKPFPLFSATGQAETLLGTAVVTLIGQAAVSGSVSEADVSAALADVQSQLEAAG